MKDLELDLDFVRKQFPAFTSSKNSSLIFFENAGGSYVPKTVVDRMNRFFVEHKMQPYGASKPSSLAGEEMEESYRAMAQLINAQPNELTFGPSTTLNFYVLARGLRHLCSAGDEIIVTDQDHEANIGAWRRWRDSGIAIREWRIKSDTGELDIDDLKKLITHRTKLVCFTLCSNIVGTHNDVESIVELAHNVGALVVADGVSYAPHVIPDVQTLGVDFYAYSTYKTFGTHQGILWGTSDALLKIQNQGHSFNASEPRYRLNPTGPQHAEIAALAGVTHYFDLLYDHHYGISSDDLHVRAQKIFELISLHETRLSNKLLDFLSEHPNIRLIGQDKAAPGKRSSTITFIVNGIPSKLIEEKLAENEIAVGSGNFYAPRCVKALGIDPSDGVVRVSMVHYNTEDEVDCLTKALETFVPYRKNRSVK